MNDRLFRSRTDRVIAGVCGGVADRFDMDPSLVRVGFAILWLLTGIVPFTVIYIVMAVVVPEEPGGAWAPGAPGFGGPAYGPPAAGTEAAGPAGDPLAMGGQPVAGAAAPAGDAPPAESAPAAPALPGAIPSWNAGGWGQGDWRASQRAERDERRAARRAARAERRNDPFAAVIVGIVLITVGAWFLLRNAIAIEWSVVWPAAIVAFGVVMVIIAVIPRPGRH